jgi:isoleucyl-tRNA synthetase
MMKKCTRCWHRDSSVGQSKSHPEICLRCEENIDSSGGSKIFCLKINIIYIF